MSRFSDRRSSVSKSVGKTLCVMLYDTKFSSFVCCHKMPFVAVFRMPTLMLFT